MQANKPLPHLTIRSGPWAGTMVRFSTIEQLRAVQQHARKNGANSEDVLRAMFNTFGVRVNAPQPKES